MTQEQIKSTNELTGGNTLLADNLDFLVTRVGGSYSNKLNVTYRWPRKIGDTDMLSIATTTINAESLLALRVEELNGQFFVVSDRSTGLDESIKLSVQSEKVGHDIVKAIIEEFLPEDGGKSEKDLLDVPKEYWRVNEIAENFAPLIMISCAVLISISLSFWLVFR